MKLLTTTAITLALTSALQAGGLADPIEQVSPVAQSFATWTGPYAGISYGQTTETTDIDDIYVYECVKGGSRDRHNNNKCVVDEYTWNNSPEVQALEHNNKPWGQYTTQYRYNQPDYDGVWLGGAESFVYTTDRVMDAPAVIKPTNTTLIDTISETISETDGAGVFAGYRQQFGSAVIGGEVSTDGTLSTAELSAGLAVGDVLAYGFVGAGRYDDLDGSVYGGGIDYRLSPRWTVGAKVTSGDFGETTTETAAIRIGFNF